MTNSEPTVSPTAAPVVVVGGGPVGLATALGLAHHGVRSLVVERDLDAPRGSRAFGIWGRTLETLNSWGLVEPFLEAGDARHAVAPHDVRRARPIFSIDFSTLDAETAMPGLLLLPQSETERLLRAAIDKEPLATLVEGECMGVRDEGDHVVVTVKDAAGRRDLTAPFVVGADGSRSAVRESLGMRHAGDIIDMDLVVFDVELDDHDIPPVLLDPRRPGLLAALRFAPRHWRVLMTSRRAALPASHATEGPPPRKPDIPRERLEPEVVALFGDRPHRIKWQSQSTLYQQRISRFRVGRVIFAGDSAHLVSPAGGQGMNQGLQDAENLAWSLAAVLRGADADAMLGGYDIERVHVADVVARRARLNSLLEFGTPTWSRRPAFWALRTLLRSRLAMRILVRRLSMRDLNYRASGAARLGGGRAAGMRMPDLVLDSGERLSAVLRGRPGIVVSGADAVDGVPPGVAVVRVARFPRRLRVRDSDVVVVRPDRHVGAVVRRPTAAQVRRAVDATCGPIGT